MTQSETVQAVQSLEQLESAKKPVLVELLKQFKEEDTECLQDVKPSSRKPELVTALAEYMGFTEEEEAVIEQAVEENISEGDDLLSLLEALDEEEDESPALVDIIEKSPNIEIIHVGDAPKKEAKPVEETEVVPEKPKKEKKRLSAIPMDAPIPAREFAGLTLGIYGNILEQLEEPDEDGYEYAELKLERFNQKAHEAFRETNGFMKLVYTEMGGKYLITRVLPDGSVEPVMEVGNKGRGHLRSKQLANILLLAHDGPNDQEKISVSDYNELISKIELIPVKLPVKEEAK